MPLSNFDDFWGSSENAYSSVLAQTLALSPPFRQEFGKLVAAKADPSLRDVVQGLKAIVQCDEFECDVVCEKFVPRIEDGKSKKRFLDALLTVSHGGKDFNLAIENKARNANFTWKQLEAINSRLRDKENTPYLIVLIASASYLKKRETKREISSLLEDQARVIQLSFEELSKLVAAHLGKKPSAFEQSYFVCLQSYLENIEMIIKNEGLSALDQLGDALRAQKTLIIFIQEICEELDFEVESNPRFGISGWASTAQPDIFLNIGIRWDKKFHPSLENVPLSDGAEVFVFFNSEKNTVPMEFMNSLKKRIGEVGLQRALQPRRFSNPDAQKNGNKSGMVISKSLQAFVRPTGRADEALIKNWIESQLKIFEKLGLCRI